MTLRVGRSWGALGAHVRQRSFGTFRLLPILVVLLGCPSADASTPAPPGTPEVVLQAAGDSVKLFFHWTPGARATQYVLSVDSSSAAPWDTVGTWKWVMNAASGLKGAIVGTNTRADSSDFVVCVRSLNTSGMSAPTCSVPKRWRRPPGPPAQVIWDSLKVANTQETGEVCLAYKLPPVQQWNSLQMNYLTCPDSAWSRARFQYIAKDKQGYVRSCPAWIDKPGLCEWRLI